MATTPISNMVVTLEAKNPPKLQAAPAPSSSSHTLVTTTRKPSIMTCKAISTQLKPERPMPPKQEQLDISSIWRKLHGEDKWAGLLDPLDPGLRLEIIRYGEMAQATYDSFDYDPYSKYCGSCRYPHEKLFEYLDMTHMGYTVSRYIYATANVSLPSFFKRSRFPHKMWSDRANWAGYIAVSDDQTSKRLGRRDIAIAWRGTVTHTEWLADLTNYLRPLSPEIPCGDQGVKVEAGFMDLYTDKSPQCRFCKYSARHQILSEVRKLVEKYEDEEVSITITGHSLGSALAVLSAFDLAETGLNVKKDGSGIHISVITFAGPRVGNWRFKQRLELDHGVKVLRVVNTHDIVPKSPGFIINESSPEWVYRLFKWLPWSYAHVGVQLELNHRDSPDLNPNGDASCAHNLEAYLHLIDGYQGSNLGFKSATGRDVALVNKSCDFVKDKHSVPPVWWQDMNKGLVRSSDGLWRQPERPRHVDHPEDIDHHLNQLGLLQSQS
ncbi:phospholipase A1-Igamma2, chloroplastic isoform X1 [Arachis ipaensis]|uniref:Fungal lipase-type domain-containing protein n=2 Tax=Arachis TaxID=3817 RepID=A0A444YGJ5_ARAHY|nr:phospholipase A1-Igamma2, chloroplastic isoform X1 [Arachis ipaensis]XP_025657964.1 phospholipase A1-Igamma2, chloroplastic [Arachis hypogaea]QHN84154.1 Phospholipase A1-Igamma2 [Arachis hypogaea]RYR01048.1 hypothetical protein Ahy_B06g079906 [Arachis hypogaea]